MGVNRGKQFEEVIRKSFERVPDTSVIRLPDPTSGYLGVRNISDFVVYHHPFQYFIECKSVHGNTFPLSNITKNQRLGMLEEVEKVGIKAGIICWWVDKDVTTYIPIQLVQMMLELDRKSIRYDQSGLKVADVVFPFYTLKGKKKRVFFDYDMKHFFEKV